MVNGGTFDQMLIEIRQELATLPGLERCYDGVPDSINQLPAIVVYPGGMRWRLASHSGERGWPMRRGLYTVRVELHVARKDLERDVELAMTFSDTIPDALFAGFHRDRFGGKAVTLGDPARAGDSVSDVFRGEFLGIGWGGDQTLGWRIEFDVTTDREIMA